MDELNKTIKNEIRQEINRLKEKKAKTTDNQEKQRLLSQINGLITAGQITQDILFNYNK